MLISNTVLKHYLKNCYFITGTAYAGKSTMCKMLAEKYGLIHCEENYMLDKALEVISPEEYPNLSYFQRMRTWQDFLNRTPEEYPNLSYFQRMRTWQDFLNRTPEEYQQWIDGTSREITDFEIAELIRISETQKVIVDTSIPLDILKQIASHQQVAIMLSPQSMSVDRFFQRPDSEKQFLLSQIHQAEDPSGTMQNFLQCIARVNSQARFDTLQNSGFFTVVRNNALEDTRQQTLEQLALHFGFSTEVIPLIPGGEHWKDAMNYAEKSAWESVGPHLADMMRRNQFTDWETVFICLVDGNIAGYCTFLEYDFYPENRYSPWISTIFVAEKYRGYRLSHKMIEAVIQHAKAHHFSTVYIPSDMCGFYEKCGFQAIDSLKNYNGDFDTIYMRKI